ncbi:MAG: AAA family ATPase, partial [Patescibacteria group bacterium]
MLLKRLELVGFKSFAEKTVLEFPGGIAGIVGPNGSGKSNVLDAVRWILGEREAKNLRGDKAEDLIFAGTPKKSRLGQAQASLHFENEKNFFQLEFAEISISRQVDRDGSNKFFLNKSEIRLKDLIDFFAKVRLGTKGLVVISQGNSDIFVQASPAGQVTLEPLGKEQGLRDWQDQLAGGKYVASLLDGLPVREGDRVRATLFGSRWLDLRVKSTRPKGV